MEAKNTVMTKSQINKLLKMHGSSIPSYIKWDKDHPLYRELLAQAEITWGLAIREVVKWLDMQNLTTSGLMVHIKLFDWQAKLKSWGIK